MTNYLKEQLVYIMQSVHTFLGESIIKLSCNVSGRYSGKGCIPENGEHNV